MRMQLVGYVCLRAPAHLPSSCTSRCAHPPHSFPPFCQLAGSNLHGQLGIEGPQTVAEPQLMHGKERWASMAFGAEHAAGLTCIGQLYTWGFNSHGQLGHSELNSVVPVPTKPALSPQLEFK
jgi:hypothetical protein